MKKLILSLIAISSICQASEKVYIDENDLDSSKQYFRIHVGHNNWLKTGTMHSDNNGLYTFENDIFKEGDKESQYVQQWKCPYCYTYNDMGKACSNANCPSKFKP